MNGGAVGVDELAAVGSDVYFLWSTALPDCNEFEDQCYRTRLWTTDGTAEGTHRVLTTDLWYADQLTAVGSRLFFVSDRNLWTSDGTASGTRRLSSASDVVELTAVGDGVVFQGCRSATGCELWTSDGTAGGTRLVKDIAGGGQDSSPRHLTAVGERVFFEDMTIRPRPGRYGSATARRTERCSSGRAGVPRTPSWPTA